MNNKYFIKIFILLLVVISIFIIFERSTNLQKTSQKKLCFENNCFNIKIARTLQERQQGLMFRESLGELGGLLFVFDKQEDQTFWMKNTLIPLDLIGLDENFIVLDIIKNFQPCRIDPCEIKTIKNSKYVLEVNAGVVEKFYFNAGDKAELI